MQNNLDQARHQIRLKQGSWRSLYAEMFPSTQVLCRAPSPLSIAIQTDISTYITIPRSADECSTNKQTNKQRHPYLPVRVKCLSIFESSRHLLFSFRSDDGC